MWGFLLDAWTLTFSCQALYLGLRSRPEIIIISNISSMIYDYSLNKLTNVLIIGVFSQIDQ